MGALLLAIVSCFAQKKPLPVLKTEVNTLAYKIGSDPYVVTWGVDPKLKPDVLDVPIYNEPVDVIFKSTTDSIFFKVGAGQNYDFIVLVRGSDTAYTRISGVKFVKAATFSNAYKKANDKKTSVEIPPVYELVNIMFALTPSAHENENFVYKKSAYYADVIKWFDAYKNEPIVARLDSALKQNNYFQLKMDAYAFEYAEGKITPSKTYDRISWGNTNTLRPYVKQLAQFAQKSNFSRFYKKHQRVYEDQISCYRDSINTTDMVSWLRQNFPTTTYNAFKIIFSPLVSWNQSANWFEDNGFKEAQAHVNFPYISPTAKAEWSKEALNLKRGSIVFTEINHSFINPELDKHLQNPEFKSAFTNLDTWLDKSKAAGSYYNSTGCLNEYMNWGLVSLYYADRAPRNEVAALVQGVETNMKNRGFKKFEEFDTFLVDLFQKREPNKTLADLYPHIIDWFAKNATVVGR